MIKSVVTAIVLSSVTATGALASGSVTLNEETKNQIRAVLTEQGYEVGKIKTEDGLYEAYARKDGKRLEVFLDADFAIVRTEVDD